MTPQVGVVTFHNSHNYGAMLQAYGLQQTLIGLRYSSYFIDLHPEFLDAANRKFTPIRSYTDHFKRLLVLLNHRKLSIRYSSFESFKNNNLKLGQRYITPDAIRQAPPKYTRFICGSDQIWNVQQGLSPHYFLDWVPQGALRIAYAPSFGFATIPCCHKPAITKLLTNFSAVSVREQSGVEIIRSITGVTPEVVLDPVFLLPVERWREIMIHPTIKGPYLVMYSLENSRELSTLVTKASKLLQVPIVVLGKPGSYIFRNKCKIAIDAGPAEFLGWIANARAVITNSFHATAFSIIFNIPFAVYPHSTRNTRIEHILNVAGMEHRLTSNKQTRQDQLASLLTALPHDGRFPAGLENAKSKSLSFLETSLDQ